MDNIQPKLLIVDDNPKNLQVLGKTLEQLNYQFEFSISGESALEWIKNQVFDLILLDIMMPGMSGLEVCKIIRTNRNYDNVPILFLSAETDKNTILEGFELGAQDYITKPFDPRELFARVKTQLELKFGREQLKIANHLLEQKVTERTIELKSSNEKLANANMDLMELDKVKTEFLNIISHEIRTPLNGILGPIELIKNELKDANLTKLFEVLDYSVSRLEKFTLTALVITELKAGIRKVPIKNISLNDLIQDALITINELAKSKNLKFDTATFSEEVVIKGDFKLLKMCLKGILENAVIYSPSDGTIFIRVENINNQITCEIYDEGPGFSDIALKNLYKLFRPGEPHMDQNIGLDLTLARLIMESHKGKIAIENLPAKGALIRLIFPANDESHTD